MALRACFPSIGISFELLLVEREDEAAEISVYRRPRSRHVVSLSHSITHQRHLTTYLIHLIIHLSSPSKKKTIGFSHRVPVSDPVKSYCT